MSNSGNDKGLQLTNKFAFKFNKVSKPKSVIVPLKTIAKNEADDQEDGDDVDFVTSIDNNTIKGTKSNTSKEKKEYVIPLIRVNKYRINIDKKNGQSEDAKVQVKTEDDDLHEKAKLELIQETNQPAEESNTAWQSLIINKVPDEYENDSKLDVTIRPEEPTLDDYNNIPVGVFGLAMLRGMGWKEGEAIGGANKAITPVYEPKLRSKGLGLGADASLKQQLESKAKCSTSTDEILRKGSYVYVEFGKFKGLYGIIDSVHDSIPFVSVKLHLLKEIFQLPQVTLRVVTKNEYDKESRIINKAKYDNYKSKETNSEINFENKKSSNHIDESHNEDKIWVVPRIRVQIMDKKFYDGRYYKDKVVIVETSGKKCTCQTKSKRILKDVPQSMLRTVIPHDSAYVMILWGKYKGKLAKIDHINWKENTATVKISGLMVPTISISLDDISEYYD